MVGRYVDSASQVNITECHSRLRWLQNYDIPCSPLLFDTEFDTHTHGLHGVCSLQATEPSRKNGKRKTKKIPEGMTASGLRGDGPIGASLVTGRGRSAPPRDQATLVTTHHKKGASDRVCLWTFRVFLPSLANSLADWAIKCWWVSSYTVQSY